MLKFQYTPNLIAQYGEEFRNELLKILQDPTNQTYINTNQWEKLFDRVAYQEEDSDFVLISAVVEILTRAEIDFLPYVYKLPNYFLSESNIENIVIPGNVKEIGEQAFSYCDFLTSAIIEEGVKILDDRVFSGCSQLKTVELPRSLNYIGIALFDGCFDLQEVTYKGPKHLFVQLVDDFKHRANISSLLGYASFIIHCTDGDLLYEDNSFR